MEEKQFDVYQFIGFILIAMILTWMFFRNENSSSQNIQSVESNTSLEVDSSSNNKRSR